MSLAFVFPGQGSQFVGMGRELTQWSSRAKDTFEEADDALGFAISRMCHEGPEKDLRLTENTQPAILTASIAAFRALKSQVDKVPSYMAGHSLGEYSALTASGRITFPDAVRAVRERGRAMQEAVPSGKGAMAALIGVDRETTLSICAEASEGGGLVSPANFNAPGQIVIAGLRENVLRAIEIFREQGGRKAVELPVSAPFHCLLMEPAAKRMLQVLEDIHIDSPKTVLINNAEAVPLTEAAQIAPSLVRQVTSPVLWEDSVRVMTSTGVATFLELGPGKVLSGLIRRIDSDVVAQSFGSPRDLDLVAKLLEVKDV
jgi:[acyl-carrier-protein] S-malonyltransferase